MEKEVLIALKGLQFALDEEGANAGNHYSGGIL